MITYADAIIFMLISQLYIVPNCAENTMRKRCDSEFDKITSTPVTSNHHKIVMSNLGTVQLQNTKGLMNSVKVQNIVFLHLPCCAGKERSTLKFKMFAGLSIL